MEIRPYQDHDQQGVIDLWLACGLIVPQNDPKKDIQRKLAIQPELFLVGVIEDKVVASVMGGYEGHRGWINYLAVSPSHQRKGYGEKMMIAIESLLKQKGCPKINLQVRTTNEAVQSFYQAIGYSNDPVISFGKRLEQDSAS